ncbi:MAG TPA: 5-oxoprolinase subunit PxpA [Nitrospiraceae bacterium]|nr:5-oxoprolinase subunit PxpA [Nitrospiraceae bacterium]
MRIDLNCDMGEFDASDRQALDETIMPLVTSVSIACGFHAGNQDLMRRTVRLARMHGAAIGAHPSFADRENFGRVEQTLPAEQIENLIAYQVGALAGIAALERASLNHVKPHGGLYSLAARDPIVAEVIARTVATFDRRLILFGLAGSQLIDAGRRTGLVVAQEAFVDRAYQPDGTLLPRRFEGAVIHDERRVLDRVRRLVRDGRIETSDGTMIQVHPDTICLHGDTPGACNLAKLIRQELTHMGVQLQAIHHACL